LIDRQDDPLTARQLEVIELVVRGLPNKEVAARLGIKRRAVEATLTRIYEKLGVDSRSGLIAFALSERGFGLALAQRPTPPSAIDALGARALVVCDGVSASAEPALASQAAADAALALRPLAGPYAQTLFAVR